MENEKVEESNRPVTVWAKVHAIALCVLAVVGIVMFVGPYVERLFAQKVGQPAPQPVAPKTVNVLSPYGLPPVQTIDGKAVWCAAPATYEDLAQAFVCVCKAPKHPPIGSGVI